MPDQHCFSPQMRCLNFTRISRDRPPPLKMEVQFEIGGEGKRLGVTTGRDLYQLSVRQNKNLLDIQGSCRFIERNGTVSEDSVYSIHERVFASLSLRERQGLGGSPLVVMDTNAPEAFKKLVFDGRCGWMLDGYFYGSDNQSVIELLKNAETLEIVPDPDHQNLVHLQGRSKFGFAEGWFDPNKRYMLVGYRITKGPQDFFEQSQLINAPGPSDRPTTVGWQTELSDVETVEVNGFPIVTSGIATLTLVDARGDKNALVYRIKRSWIQVDTATDVLASADTFMSEGIEVKHQQQPGIKYSYVNNELRPTVDMAAIKQIDALLDKHRAGGKDELDPIESNSRSEQNTYCGLYCLYARAKLASLDVSFEGLLRPEFVGSVEGMSIGELALAANSLGLEVQIYSDLTPQQLREAPLPLILHVRQNLKSMAPDHYILLLEINGDAAIVFDPPTETRGSRIRSVGLPVLAAQWSRAAIATSPPGGAVSMEGRIIGRAIEVAILALSASFLLTIVNRFMRVRKNSGIKYCARFPTQVLTITLLSLLAATVFGVIASDGIRLDETGRQAAQILYQRRYPSVLNVAELLLRKHNGGMIFIDARVSQGSSFIPHALHIPYNASASLRMQKLTGIDKSTRLISYCEPFGCPVAGRLAILLEDDGFTNVQVLVGDWRSYANSAAK